jgi:hypothetical protein
MQGVFQEKCVEEESKFDRRIVTGDPSLDCLIGCDFVAFRNLNALSRALVGSMWNREDGARSVD